MKKQASRAAKLTLSKERIRELTLPELRPVVGGLLDTCPAASADNTVPTPSALMTSCGPGCK